MARQESGGLDARSRRHRLAVSHRRGLMVERLSVFPFFLGCGRSGTTLLRALFDAHPDLAIPGESVFISTMCSERTKYETIGGVALDRFVADVVAHPRFETWGLPERVLRDALRLEQPNSLADAIRVLFATYATSREKKRYGDKTPVYVLAIPLLAPVFPEARFVHIIRDGRNVAPSLMELPHGPKDLGKATLYWRRHVQRGRKAGARLGPQRYREIRYESLTADAERVVRELCGFLELTYDDRMVQYVDRSADLTRTFTAEERGFHRNLSLPPTSGLRDWRRELSGRDIELIEALAGDLLDDLGYERANGAPGVGSRAQAAEALAREWSRRVGHRLVEMGGDLVKRTAVVHGADRRKDE